MTQVVVDNLEAFNFFMKTLGAKNQEATAPRSIGAALSFDEFKATLGPTAEKYTDEEIDKMRLVCDQIADVFFDNWLMKRNSAI